MVTAKLVIISERTKSKWDLTSTSHPGRGVYRSSYMNARRLAATETNIAYRTADHLRWQKMDFVVGIEIVLSDNHTIRLQPGEKTSDLPGQMRADGTPKAEQTEIKTISLNAIALSIKKPTFVTEKEVKTALTDFATANPSLFNGGLVAVKITRSKSIDAFMGNSRSYYKATGAYDKKGNTIITTNNNFVLASGDVFNPLHEVKGAMKAIAKKEPLTFKQEYALESVWHEIRHATAFGWKNVHSKTIELTNAMEVINQFCARMSYPSFIRGLGGKATHATKVMEKGYGYSQSISNFNTLLKHMKVSKKAAYKHFGDMIVQKPYEDIYSELVKFVEQKGKYDNKNAQDIVKGLKEAKEEFQKLL